MEIGENKRNYILSQIIIVRAKIHNSVYYSLDARSAKIQTSLPSQSVILINNLTTVRWK